MSVTKNFTDHFDAIEYIVEHVYKNYSIETRLNKLVLNTGEVITNMPIFRYIVVPDIEDPKFRTLDVLEFRDGPEYDSIVISRIFWTVTSFNRLLGTMVSIDLDVTLGDPEPCSDNDTDYITAGGEYENVRPSCGCNY